jgi:hypothetical protein
VGPERALVKSSTVNLERGPVLEEFTVVVPSEFRIED